MNGPAAAFSDPEVLNALRITTIGKDTPVYIEVYRRLRRLIKQGVLKYGDQLPGEYALAEIMCVGRTSLRTALSILYEDGYIKIMRGKGSCVMGDSRPEKYRKLAPEGIVFPTERIELLGELTKSKGHLKFISEEDEFLAEKLAPKDEDRIMSYQRLYYLNGNSAILSYYYFLDSLADFTGKEANDEAEEKILEAVRNKTMAAECECFPVKTINSIESQPVFPGENQLLVITKYVGDNKIIAYCKDYYNCEVIRFSTALKR